MIPPGPAFGAQVRRPLTSESGFTIVELLVAVFVIATGAIALLGAVDSSRNLTTVSERKEAAAHAGQQEIERLQALDYDQIALTAAPAGSSDPDSPAYYVTAGSPPGYRWNQEQGATASEPFAIDVAKGVSPEPVPWNDGRLSGQIHRYVTRVDDASCGVLCPADGDYKRITVAVTVDGDQGPRKPILLSSLTSDPDTGPLEGVVDGVQNPLASPDTQCLEGGQWVECAGSAAGNVVTWFAHDTPAEAGTRQAITGDHSTHPTVAPLSALLCTLLDTSGCPKPDLLGPTPPPTEDGGLLPQLFDYSNEVTGEVYPGGRVLRRDVGCSETPSSDNSKGEMWTTAPLDDPMELTGEGGVTVHSQTLGGAPAGATLCVRFYDVPNSLLNLIALPPTTLGTVSYTLPSWPQTPAPVSFNFDFLSSNVTVPAGRRVGMRIWVAGSSGADLALLYDHPSYPTSVQLNSL